MKQIGLVKALWLVRKADRMTDEKRLDLQKRRLRELVSYAKNRSPYFAILYQDVDENTPLTALPTTSKADKVVNWNYPIMAQAHLCLWIRLRRLFPYGAQTKNRLLRA